MFWNWYKKNRKSVAWCMTIFCVVCLALNIAGMIIQPDTVGAVAVILNVVATILWVHTLLDEGIR